MAMLPVRSCLATFRQLSTSWLRNATGPAEAWPRSGLCSRSGGNGTAAAMSRGYSAASGAAIAAEQHKTAADWKPLPARTDVAALLARANEQIAQGLTGRLFAVVHVSGKQFKVTPEDIVVVEGEFGPEVGERIRLEKVLLVGGEDFTMVGRPLLSPEEVLVEATVIEKTLQYPKAWLMYKRRKRVKRFRLLQKPLVMLRINEVRALTVKS